MADQTDLLFLNLDVARIGPGAQLAPLEFGKTPRVTSGIQKAIQSFLALLLTKRGEAWNTELGCYFLAAAEQGRIRTSVDARNYFASDVPELLVQVNSGATSEDETLVSAVLEGVSVERDRMTLRIRLTNASGVTTVILAPV